MHAADEGDPHWTSSCIGHGNEVIGDFDWNFASFRPSGPDVPRMTLTDDALAKIRMDRETDVVRHRTVPHDMARAITSKRVSMNMTQRQLATRVNMDHARISAREAATAVYNPSDLNRLQRVLGYR